MSIVHKYLNNGIYFIATLLLATQAITIALLKPQTVKADTSITNIGHIGGYDAPPMSSQSIAFDSSGNIYVSSSGSNTSYIVKFNSSGNFLDKIGSNGTSDGEFMDPNVITFDSSGNMYVADTYNQRIQKFDSSGNFIAKWGANGGDGTSGTAEGEFKEPEGITIDSSGDLYVVDSHNYRIQKFDSSGNFISMFGWGVDDGTNEFQTCTVGCQAGTQGYDDGQFFNPQVIDIDSNGNLVLSDENRIQKLSPSGSFISAFGWGVDDGTAEFQSCTSGCQAGIEGAGDGQFNRPYGIVLDTSDDIYIADGDNHRVQKFSSSGAFITKWGANGGDGTSGTADGEFGYVRGITLDSSGNVYVADNGNYRVQKFGSSGQYLSTFGTFDYDDLVMTYGSLGLDSDENIYFANAGAFFNLPDNSIKKYSLNGQSLGTWPINDYVPYTVAASPTGLYAMLVDFESEIPSVLIRKTDFSGNTITEWSMSPEDGFGMFTVDSQDNMYVADGVNNRIVKRNGNTGAIIDTFGEPGTGDGQLNLGEEFVSLSVDQFGSVFVTDANNHRIQKFDSSGNFLMKFGSEGTGDGEFSELVGITIGNDNSIYVSEFQEDEDSGRIQKFDSNGNYISQYVQQPDGLTWGFVPATMAVGSNGRIYALNFMGGYRIEILCDQDVSTDGCASIGGEDNGLSDGTELSSAENGTPIILSQSGCSSVDSSSTSKESSNAVQDIGYNYPVGLVGFRLSGCNSTATVTLTFTGNYNPSGIVLRKYNPVTHAYTTLTQANSNLSLSTTTLNNSQAIQAEYTITDNGDLDLDPVTGTITDPVGIATQSTGAANTGLNQYWLLNIKE